MKTHLAAFLLGAATMAYVLIGHGETVGRWLLAASGRATAAGSALDIDGTVAFAQELPPPAKKGKR